MKEPLAPGYRQGVHGDAHPDTDRYPGYYLDFIQPSEDLQTALWVYIKAQQVIDQKITTEYGGGDLNIIRTRGTKIYSGFSGFSGYSVYPPFILDEGIPVISSEITDLIDGDMVKETVELQGSTNPTLTLTGGGSGYTCAPAVSFVGGVGSGAVATSEVAFAVASINVTNGGSGYASAPTVFLSSQDGNGQSATAIAALAYTVAALAVLNGGFGYTSAPTVALTGGGGTGATATAQLGFAIASIAVTNQGSNYTAIPSVLLTGGGGAGAIAQAILGYPLSKIRVSTGGTNYTSAPTVIITPAAGDGGSGAAATAVVSTGVVSVLITNGGTTYASPPTVAFSGGLGAGGIAATGTSVLGFPIASANVTANGSGYTSAPSLTVIGDGTGATATAQLGITQASAIANLGSGYSVNDILTLVGGASTTAAQIEVSSVNGGGGITGFTIHTVGVYSTLPSNNVALSGGTGTSATLTAAWYVSAATVTAGGNGYTFANISVSGGGGSGAAIHPVLAANGTVKSVTITSPGSGYTSAPTVVFSGGGGTGAAATATISGTVESITLTNPGVGYSVPPTISFSGGGGTGASGVATLSGGPAVVSYIQMVSNGSGYTSAPSVSIVPAPSDTTGSGATATASLAASGSVIGFTITNAGTGYTSPPAVGLSGGAGTGASAYSQLASTGSVKTVSLTNPGSGYTLPPLVFFLGGQGTGAAATAVLASTGSVVAVNLTSPGSYTTAPTVNFSGCNGAGASATYNLPTAQWPILLESHTDEQTGIVVEITKQIVPAGTQFFQQYITPQGAIGPVPQFVDINALDKWRSIQITSKIDPNSLPPPYIIGTSMRYDFPDILLDINAAWGDAVGNDTAYQNTVPTSTYRLPSAHAGGSSSCDGDIVLQLLYGPKGWMQAEHRQSFFYGPPNLSDIPLPFIFQEVEGTATLQATAAKVSSEYGTATGSYSQEFQLQTRSRPLGPFLSRYFLAKNGIIAGQTTQLQKANHIPPASISEEIAYLTSGGGDANANDGNGPIDNSSVPDNLIDEYDVTVGIFGGFGNVKVTLPLSFQGTTTNLVNGQVPSQIVIQAEATRWRFGVWVLDVWFVNIPANYLAFL